MKSLIYTYNMVIHKGYKSNNYYIITNIYSKSNQSYQYGRSLIHKK